MACENTQEMKAHVEYERHLESPANWGKRVIYRGLFMSGLKSLA